MDYGQFTEAYPYPSEDPDHDETEEIRADMLNDRMREEGF